MNREETVSGGLVAKNTLLNIAGQVIPFLVGIVTIPYLVHHLRPSGFGVLSIGWICLGYFSLFDFGLGRATTRFLAERLHRGDYHAVPIIVWTSVALQIPLGIGAGLFIAGITPLLVTKILKVPFSLIGETETVFFILAAAIPVVNLNNCLRSVMEAAQRFDLINYIRVPGNVAVFLLPVLALSLGSHLPGVILLLALARVASAVAHLILCFRLFPVLRQIPMFQRSIVSQLLTYGGWVTVSSSLGPVILYMDRFMVGSLLSMSALGYYTAPFEIITRLGVLPGSLIMALFPVFSMIGGSERELVESLYARATRYLLLVVGPIALFLIIFANNILQLWLGDVFAQNATATLRILGVGALIASLAPLSGCMLQGGLTRPDIVAKLYVLEAPVNFALLLILIKHMGISGAAVTYAIRALFETASLLFLSTKIARLRFRRITNVAFREPAVALSGLAMMLWATHFLFASLVLQIIFTLVAFTGFAIGVWYFVLTDVERCHWIRYQKFPK